LAKSRHPFILNSCTYLHFCSEWINAVVFGIGDAVPCIFLAVLRYFVIVQYVDCQNGHLPPAGGWRVRLKK
jgi:hypothetical protein